MASSRSCLLPTLHALRLLSSQRREIVRRRCGELNDLIPKHPFSSGGIRKFAFWNSEICETSTKLSYALGTSSRKLFSSDISHIPAITDPDVERAFKDLMAASWDEIPHAVLKETENALSKSSDDRTGQEALANVLRSAEAAEHFLGVLVSLRMEIDDSVGLSGENAGPMHKDIADALDAAYRRYTAYLDAFGPDEVYLRKKVETELGAKMIQLKLRCGGLGSEWGKAYAFCIGCVCGDVFWHFWSSHVYIYFGGRYCKVSF